MNKSIINNCPICGHSEYVVIKENKNNEKSYLDQVSKFINILECTNCQFAYRFPILSNDNVLSNYEENPYWSEVSTNIYYNKRAESRVLFLSDYDNLISNYENVLEIGSFNGAFLEVFKSKFKNIKTYSLETDNNAIKYLQSKGIKSFDPNIKYNIISAFHVIEHYPNPIEFIEETILPYLENDGLIVLEVPFRDYETKKCFSEGFHHVSFYSPQNFEIIATKLGLKVLKLNIYGKTNFKLRSLINNKIFRLCIRPLSIFEKIIFQKNYVMPYLQYLTLNDKQLNEQGSILRVVLSK